QVNFNRAVNDALCDVVEILKAEAHELASMRAQLTQEMRREFSTLRSDTYEQTRRMQEMENRADRADAALAHVNQVVAGLYEENRRGHKKLAEKNLQIQNDLTSFRAEHSALEAEQARLRDEHIHHEAEHSKLV